MSDFIKDSFQRLDPTNDQLSKVTPEIITEIYTGLGNIFLFKVADYTTILLGRFDEEKKCFYVQRGDGVRYDYDEDRIVYKLKLDCNLIES